MLNLLFGAPSGLPGISASPVVASAIRVASESEGKASGWGNFFWCEAGASGGERCHLRAWVDVRGRLPKFVELVELRVFWTPTGTGRRAGSAQGRRPERANVPASAVAAPSMDAFSASWLPTCAQVPAGTLMFAQVPAGCSQGTASMSLDRDLSGRVEVITDPDRLLPTIGMPIEWRRFLRTNLPDTRSLSISMIDPWQLAYLGGSSFQVQVTGLLVWPSGYSDSGTIVLPELWRLRRPLPLSFRR
jgi:hypothetical protein